MKRFFLCLLLLLTSAGPGWAYTIVQNVTGGDSTGSSVTTLTLTISAIGNHNNGMGYVSWYQGGTGAPTVSIKFGSNDTASIPQQVSGDGEWLAAYYLNNVTDAPTSVVFTFSGGGANQGRFISANFTEVSGAGAIDTSTMQFATLLASGTTDAITSGNITPAASGDFLFGGTMCSNIVSNTSVTISGGTNYTLNNNNTTNSADPMADEYQTYNSATAVAATFTFTGNNAGGADFITGIMGFPVAAATANCGSLARLGVGC